MSNLAVTYLRRQPLRRVSNSTEASDEAQERINKSSALEHDDKSSSGSNEQNTYMSQSKTPMNVNIISSNDIKLGEHITNIYNNCFSKVKLKIYQPMPPCSM
jgi:hypothetical protein